MIFDYWLSWILILDFPIKLIKINICEISKHINIVLYINIKQQKQSALGNRTEILKKYDIKKDSGIIIM